MPCTVLIQRPDVPSSKSPKIFRWIRATHDAFTHGASGTCWRIARFDCSGFARIRSEEFENPRSLLKSEHGSVVVIDCKDEHWDETLDVSLYNRRAVELRNLHSSYENHMKQLASMFFMEFVGHFAENRGEFKPREAS